MMMRLLGTSYCLSTHAQGGVAQLQSKTGGIATRR